VTFDAQLESRIVLHQLRDLLQHSFGVGLERRFAGVEVDPVHGHVTGLAQLIGEIRSCDLLLHRLLGDDGLIVDAFPGVEVVPAPPHVSGQRAGRILPIDREAGALQCRFNIAEHLEGADTLARVVLPGVIFALEDFLLRVAGGILSQRKLELIEFLVIAGSN